MKYLLLIIIAFTTISCADYRYHIIPKYFRSHERKKSSTKGELQYPKRKDSEISMSKKNMNDDDFYKC